MLERYRWFCIITNFIFIYVVFPGAIFVECQSMQGKEVMQICRKIIFLFLLLLYNLKSLWVWFFCCGFFFLEFFLLLYLGVEWDYCVFLNVPVIVCSRANLWAAISPLLLQECEEL